MAYSFPRWDFLRCNELSTSSLILHSLAALRSTSTGGYPEDMKLGWIQRLPPVVHIDSAFRDFFESIDHQTAKDQEDFR